MASRRSVRRGSGTRRRMFWARELIDETVSFTDRAQIVDLLLRFSTEYGADLFGFTVTRIVGNLTYWQDSADPDGGEPQGVSVGIRVEDRASVQAIDTSAERLTTIPASDPFSDWMYVTNRYYNGFAGGTIGSVQSLISTENRWEIDLKAQRRLDELGQSLYLYLGQIGTPEATSSALRIMGDINVLCKRP